VNGGEMHAGDGDEEARRVEERERTVAHQRQIRSPTPFCVLGACTYVGLDGLGIGRLEAMLTGFLVTFKIGDAFANQAR
jgi:hypothetical protein